MIIARHISEGFRKKAQGGDNTLGFFFLLIIIMSHASADVRCDSG